MKSNNNSGYGCLLAPIIFCIGLIFLTLKLAQVGLVANWSWWLVLSPWYILPLLFLILWLFLTGAAAALTIAANLVGAFARKLRVWRAKRERERT